MINMENRTIQNLDEKRWDSVNGNILTLTHRWLRLLETGWRRFEPRYMLLENDQGAYASIIVNAIETFKNRGVMEWIYRHFILVFGTPCTTTSSIQTRPGVPLVSVMPEIVETMEKVSRKEKRPLMAVSNVNASELSAWQQAGFLATRQMAMNILDLPSTYELYLAQLRPKDRAELRRIHKRGGELDVHFEIGSLAEDGEKIFPLLKEVYSNHVVGDMPFSLKFFDGLEREFPQQTLVLKGFVGSKLSGAFLCIFDGSMLWWFVAGLDYETARPSYMYFLLIDEMVRWSIQHGIPRIFGGLTNDHEKQRHGFHAEELWFCYRASIRPLNQLLSMALPFARQLAQKHKGTQI